MKRILLLTLILLLGAFLLANDKTGEINSSEMLFAQVDQDTLADTDEDIELEITKEQDRDTLVTEEKEEDEEWKESEEWDEEKEYGMTLWDFLSRLPDTYKEEFIESRDFYKNDERKVKHKRGYFRGGAGGWDVYMLPLKVGEINEKLTNVIDIGEFSDDLFLTGGGGWAFLGRSIRIGGMGFGGYVVSDGQKNKIAKEATLRLGLGGVIIEKVFHPFNRSEIYIGTMAGGGTAALKLTQWTGPSPWDKLWNGYSIKTDPDTTFHSFFDYKTEMKSHFITLLPSIGIRYNIFRWCAVGANVGYLYTRIDQDGWKMRGTRVNEVPKIDFSNVIYRFNVYFGG